VKIWSGIFTIFSTNFHRNFAVVFTNFSEYSQRFFTQFFKRCDNFNIFVIGPTEHEIKSIPNYDTLNSILTIGVTITDSPALTEVNFNTFINIVGSNEKNTFTFKKTSIKNIIEGDFAFVSNRIYFHIEDCKLENLDDIKKLVKNDHAHHDDMDSEKLSISLKVRTQFLLE